MEVVMGQVKVLSSRINRRAQNIRYKVFAKISMIWSYEELLTGLQVLCASCKPNGTDMNEIAMAGRLKGRR